ncbi:MAG: hypothetical protein Ta2F_03980 [Termitinemataceae bacterium]|nr:MAG: hypothetical protein Ta2F_03980 [Termitinemataceae bacterium]
MSIRLKIIFVVLPLILVSLFFAEGATWITVTRGITRTAQDSLDFKLYQLENYAANQWMLLVENGYADKENMLQAAKTATQSYAATLVLSTSELIFAINGDNEVAMTTSPFEATQDECKKLIEQSVKNGEYLQNAFFAGGKRIYKALKFSPFNWYLFVSEERDTFYREVDDITKQTLIIVGIFSVLSIVLLVLFSRILIKPLSEVATTMQKIISSHDLSSRAIVEYNDETGHLAQTFNFMVSELEESYRQTKNYAFQTAIAQKEEHRIREIFQKYVPQSVIEQFFKAPESMLIGDNRDLAVLFTDIRSFTTISEKIPPDLLVQCLNRYFSDQVDIVMNRQGVVDKYIGDALMAFWGAPVESEHDPLQSVYSGLEMIDALEGFNEKQRELKLPEFHIGIGINFGPATVGNMGNERKMNYTIIGDTVNLASRTEDITKIYGEPLMITEFVYERIAGKDSNIHTRPLDSVTVKGKTKAIRMYAVKRKLSEVEERAWALHNEAMDLFEKESYSDAEKKFKRILELLPNDYSAKIHLEKCKGFVF